MSCATAVTSHNPDMTPRPRGTLSSWGAEPDGTRSTLVTMLAKGLVAAFAGFALVPSSSTLVPPSDPGPWRPAGKVVTSRLGARLHVSRTLLGMNALAFVVASKSPRRIRVTWASYCEFYSDDDYTESYSGRLSGLRRIEFYPHVFDGATLCDVAVNADPIKGARVVAAVYSY
jgi:hypothetical protein